MIKLILHGGGNLNKKELERIIREIKKDFSNKDRIKILIVPFARVEEDWKSVFDKYNKRYFDISLEKDFVLASPDIKKFKDQIDSSNVIFFTGGSEILLKKFMKYIDFSLFINKTIVGISAGANIFSSNYYSNDRGIIEKGLYELPIKTICHFDSTKKSCLKKLTSSGNSSKKPTLAINEGSFFVLYFSEK